MHCITMYVLEVAMSTLLLTSTLTDRYQTTIPEAVRKQLGLSKRDQVSYTITADGSVQLTRAPSSEPDPALKPFLSLLERDLTTHPQQVQPLDAETYTRLRRLTAGAEFDLDTELDPADE